MEGGGGARGAAAAPLKFWVAQSFLAAREIWAKPIFKEVSMLFLLLFRRYIYFLFYPEVGVVNPVKSHETVVA